MSGRLLAVAALVALLSTPAAPASALTRSFPEHNFAVELPAWWMPISPAPEQAILAIRSPKRDRSVFISSTSNPRTGAVTEDELLATARQGFIDQKFTVTGERRTESNGLVWITVAARGDEGRTASLWLHKAGETIYSLRADHADGNVETDAEIQAALRSFRLLRAPDGKQTAGQFWLGEEHWLPLGIVAGFLLLGVTLFLTLRPSPQRKRKR